MGNVNFVWYCTGTLFRKEAVCGVRNVRMFEYDRISYDYGIQDAHMERYHRWEVLGSMRSISSFDVTRYNLVLIVD